jgi:hypothetical protein
MRVLSSAFMHVCISLFLLTITHTLTAAAAAAQGRVRPAGTPVLWRGHRAPSSLDLYWGPGGRSMRPDLRRLTFLEEEKGGYSTKYRVRDASGRVWAAGYMTEITYLAPRATIPGKGTFENVRFEARPSGVEREGEWKWEENPFVGTRELQGLKVMMVLLNNWDIKDENNVLLATNGELRYAISDLGATLGDTGKWPLLWRFTRSRNDPSGFRGDKIIDEVKEDGRVDFEFSGKKRGMFNDVTVEQARWVGGLLSGLSDRQIAAAFRAANYRPAEVRELTRALRSRINELSKLRRPRRSVR